MSFISKCTFSTCVLCSIQTKFVSSVNLKICKHLQILLSMNIKNQSMLKYVYTYIYVLYNIKYIINKLYPCSITNIKNTITCYNTK